MADRPGRPPAKYRQIAAHFRDAIDKGDLQPEDVLPSQTALQEQFGASMGTIVNALEMLRREGLVRTEHGRGTFVAERKPLPDVPGELAELRGEVADALERVGAVEAALMDLYAKGGYRYPGHAAPGSGQKAAGT